MSSPNPVRIVSPVHEESVSIDLTEESLSEQPAYIIITPPPMDSPSMNGKSVSPPLNKPFLSNPVNWSFVNMSSTEYTRGETPTNTLLVPIEKHKTSLTDTTGVIARVKRDTDTDFELIAGMLNNKNHQRFDQHHKKDVALSIEKQTGRDTDVTFKFIRYLDPTERSERAEKRRREKNSKSSTPMSGTPLEDQTSMVDIGNAISGLDLVQTPEKRPTVSS